MRVDRNHYGSQCSSFEAPVEACDARVASTSAFPFIRAPFVDAVLDPAVTPLAHLVGDPAHPVAVMQGHLLATAFHPELVAGGRVWGQFFVDMVAAHGLVAAHRP